MPPAAGHRMTRFRRLATLPLLALGLLLAGATAAEPGAGDALAEIARRHEIVIAAADPGLPVATRYGRIEGRAAPAAEVAAYAPLLAGELSRYPPDLVRRSGLRRVALCVELSFAGQRRNAVPDFEGHTLFLEVSRGSGNRLYLRKVIHHEFFHIVDLRDDGRLYRDDAWSLLNPRGFRYGAGGRSVQDFSATSVLTTRYPGFLNHYSTTGVEEDKAEVFANLLVEPEAVRRRTAEDPVLAAKVLRMRSLVAAFCPAAGDAFWEPAAPGGR